MTRAWNKRTDRVMPLVGMHLPVEHHEATGGSIRFTLRDLPVDYVARSVHEGTDAEAARRIVEGVGATRTAVEREVAWMRAPRVSLALVGLLRGMDDAREVLAAAMGSIDRVQVFGVDGPSPATSCQPLAQECGQGHIHYERGCFAASLRKGWIWLSGNVLTVYDPPVIPAAIMLAAGDQPLDAVMTGTAFEGAGLRIRAMRTTPLGTLKITLHADTVGFADALASIDAGR